MTNLIRSIRIRLFGATTHIFHDMPNRITPDLILHLHFRIIQWSDGSTRVIVSHTQTRTHWIVNHPWFTVSRVLPSRAYARKWVERHVGLMTYTRY